MNDKEYLEAILRDQTLAPGSEELKDLQQRRNEVEEVLLKEFGTAPRILEAGSKKKGTMIKASYDLDLTCYFGHEDTAAGETLKEIYNRVQNVLAGSYLTAPKGSAIRIKRLDVGTDLHIDVVPGRYVEGRSGDVFLHRSSGDKDRLKTNLDVHVAHVRDSGMTDAIRLMKLWRERNRLSVKTFALELLTIKLLDDFRGKPLTEQLSYAWEELRDHSDTIAVEDPANPSGNDISDMLNASVRASLSSTASSTLAAIQLSGWTAVFGPVKDDDRASALRRIAVSSPAAARPWSSNA
jgi:hypothetical protein